MGRGSKALIMGSILVLIVSGWLLSCQQRPTTDRIKTEPLTVLPEDVTIYKLVEEPIAFGLVALIAHLVIPEEEGRLDAVEQMLQTIEGVGQTEVLLVRRV